MELNLINQDNQDFANISLQEVYDKELIPAEKKPFLTNLEKSIGPYLAVESKDGQPRYLLDAASQIATLGLGFNSSVLMGSAQFLESWTNDTNSENFKKLKISFEKFLKRKLGWPSLEANYCNSGAEANELALGLAYKRRIHKSANKILAFEGSFHGRMMMALNSTWNKTKREPFTIPGHETIFSKHPNLGSDQIIQSVPSQWRKLWSEASDKNFTIPESWKNDNVLMDEVNCLLHAREQLLHNNIFAIIIEPMQCEGGDRYASNRFHLGLNLLAKSFQTALIIDEVQTGFHLGNEFFWHKQFNLSDQDGTPLFPDYLVCAKKAQVGMVLSPLILNKTTFESTDEFSVASYFRGYKHALILDQQQGKIKEIENYSREKLNIFLETYKEYASGARGIGLAFAFDVKNAEHVSTFVAKRFEYALLYYPAGSNTLRFRLNLAFKKSDIDFLFSQLSLLADEIFLGKENTKPAVVKISSQHVDNLYLWQRLFLNTKLSLINGKKINEKDIFNNISAIFHKDEASKLVLINKTNYSNYKDRIQNLQKEIYEPTRQTSEERFSTSAFSDFGTCIALEKEGELLAICFASSLQDHPLEKAIRKDPDFENPNALYTLDTTVHHSQQGKGYGRQMKYAMTLMAMVQGAKSISGRNRDRMASAMLSINLSLGSYQLFHIQEDYLDFEEFRDVIYYKTFLNWNKPQLNLSNRALAPFSYKNLNKEIIDKNLVYTANKMCLSNVIDKTFLGTMEQIFSRLPSSLRHGYAASGQSEAVDKLAKSIWYSVHKKKKNITFKGHFFGHGSFMSRSLSNEIDSFFEVEHLSHPTLENMNQVLKELETSLKSGEYLGVWIEPLPQKTLMPVPKDFLISLKSLCKKYNTPLIYNETGSQFYTYQKSSFYCSNDESIEPDAGLIYTGGQSSITFLSSKIFIKKPLMMISTWDGDQFSLTLYNELSKQITSNLQEYYLDIEKFEMNLKEVLNNYHNSNLEIKNGVGRYKGTAPNEIINTLTKVGDTFLILPSWSMIKEFNSKHIG